MHPEPSVWSFVAGASPLVKTVLSILFCASVASWAIVIQRALLFKKSFADLAQFEQNFWSGVDFNRLFQQLAHQTSLSGLAALFYAGFKEFRRLQDHPRPAGPEVTLDAVRRAMRIVQARETAHLEQHLPFLATVGSISPYVGLFGTVWGIMTSFRALGAVQQASIAMVAPGISEALIATAMGLFAAIPAVVAYNRFCHRLERLTQQYEVFQEELVTVLQRNLLVAKEAESHVAPV